MKIYSLSPLAATSANNGHSKKLFEAALSVNWAEGGAGAAADAAGSGNHRFGDRKRRAGGGGGRRGRRVIAWQSNSKSQNCGLRLHTQYGSMLPIFSPYFYINGPIFDPLS